MSYQKLRGVGGWGIMSYALLIKGTGKIVAEDLGSWKAEKIMEQAQRRFEELKQENAGDSRDLQRHTYKRIYPGIAMYEALRSAGVEQDKAVWYIHEYYQRFCKKAARGLQVIMKLPGMVKKAPELFVSISVKSFSESSGFQYEWPNLPQDTVGFDIVKCPYFNTCTRYGCPEITVAFCDSDDCTYGNMHPCLIWGRTSTLGHGAHCCDFRLTSVKR